MIVKKTEQLQVLKNKAPWKIPGPEKDAVSYLKYIVKNFLITEVS
jgi:hypothetical protein